MVLERVDEKGDEISRRRFLKLSALAGLPGFSGCLMRRTGCPPHPTLATKYNGEKGAYSLRGEVYTCRTGHVDIAHAKKFGRKANKHAEATFKVLTKGGKRINFKGNNPFECNADLTYPSNWENIDKDGRDKIFEDLTFNADLTYPSDWKSASSETKGKIIEEISIGLGQYFAHCNSICYETAGWFGYKKQPWVSEFSSAFSWEDRYSDAFGIFAAGFAINSKDGFKHSAFNKRISHVLNDLFQKLDIQSASVSRQAAKNVNGVWYRNPTFGGEMLMRNFDFGNDDGLIAPCIPPVDECGRNVER